MTYILLTISVILLSIYVYRISVEINKSNREDK